MGGIWLTGSLAKFHLGSNIETLTREETARGIEHLSDELNQPMADARVFRVDLAQTFMMERPPSGYLRLLLTPPRMDRFEYRTGTLTFANGQRSILFYDKLAEMRRKRERVIDRAENGRRSRFHGHPNLLRYEVQFKKSLGRAFGEKELRASSLSRPVFYEKMVNKWAEQYFKLGRVGVVCRPVGATTVKSDMKFLAELGLQSYGPQQFLDEIASDLHAGVINKYQAHRRRAKIRELSRGGGITAAGDALEELDAKVKQAVALSK